MRRHHLIALLLLFALLVPSVVARSRRHRASTGAPGQFDYYLLSLSWSPEYCAGAGSGDPTQCGGRPFAFVVHGLWPQFNAGGWPQDCGGNPNVDASIVNRMLAIMPSPKLIAHEWVTHGTCSGLAQADYFNLIQRAYSQVKIPPAYVAPTTTLMVAPADIKQQFRASNAKIPADGIALTCSGRFLSQVQICYDKNLGARSCASDVRDKCAAGQVVMRPVRGGSARQ